MQSPKRCQSRRRALEGLLVATEEAVGFKVFGAATPNGDTSDEKKSAGGEKRSGAGEVGLNIGLDGEAER